MPGCMEGPGGRGEEGEEEGLEGEEEGEGEGEEGKEREERRRCVWAVRCSLLVARRSPLVARAPAR